MFLITKISGFSDRDYLILAIILLSISGIYFLNKIINFFKLRIQILLARKDIFNSFHIYWFYTETITEKDKELEQLESIYNQFKGDVELEKFYKSFLETYIEIYNFHYNAITSGKSLQIKLCNKNFDTISYVQDIDETSNFVFQGIVIKKGEELFDNIFKIKRTDINSEKIFKKNFLKSLKNINKKIKE